MTPEKYLDQGADEVVVDFLASMTDSYFMAIYEHWFGKGHGIGLRGYCADL